jgi:prepilin-type N-terminal cleavage/methylation domain-containing protein
MENVRRHHNKGLTLIEVLVSLLIVAVAVIGAMMYRYYSASDARMADVHADAGRVGLLILEGWKGAAGRTDYNPAVSVGTEVLGSPDISISRIGTTNEYLVQLTGGTDTSYYALLSYNDDVNGDGNADPGIRKLMVEVTYYGKGSQNKTLSSKTVKVVDFVRI